MNVDPVTRRQALARLALLCGGAIVGSEAFLRGTPAGAATPAPAAPGDLALLDEIGDTILPPTDTPGAKAAGIGAFMTMMVAECYDAAHQEIFRHGLAALESACRQETGNGFVALAPPARTAFLNRLDAERRAHARAHPHGPPHYFQLLRELTLLGYFTSEIGCTQALRYVETPGEFHGDVPCKPGDRAWFSMPRPQAQS